jgi:hypothetical protein
MARSQRARHASRPIRGKRDPRLGMLIPPFGEPMSRAEDG